MLIKALSTFSITRRSGYVVFQMNLRTGYCRRFDGEQGTKGSFRSFPCFLKFYFMAPTPVTLETRNEIDGGFGEKQRSPEFIGL